jgi:alkanesulfonate monooxygenase SsuD/methylene tetrahydromethanopterin reductase-like flavin-dependent oxidoreductase (luciferase family)
VPLSLSVTNYWWPTGLSSPRVELSRVIRRAEEAGLDTVRVSDHLLQADPTNTPNAEILEAYATLGFLCALTARIRLGAMVITVTLINAWHDGRVRAVLEAMADNGHPRANEIYATLPTGLVIMDDGGD